jgi:DHA3 family macrolide efflux protein-like MFS transporter
MNPITNGPLQALAQAVVAPDMQGRVFTLIGSLSALMSPLGLIVAGPIADAVGVQAWYLIGGSACIIMALVASGIPAIMNLEESGRAASNSSAEKRTEPALGTEA